VLRPAVRATGRETPSCEVRVKYETKRAKKRVYNVLGELRGRSHELGRATILLGETTHVERVG